MIFYTKPDWTALVKENISVVIPNHNRSHLIGRAIESVLAQSLPAQEIFVVDDGSTDSSCELVSSRYPGVTLLKQEHRGVSAARNLGIRQANCDWIALLDSDDEWLPSKLEKQFSAWEKQPAYRVIHTNESWIRNGLPLKQLKKHKKSGGYIFQQCLPLCVISPSSIVVHAEVFEKVGLFNENFPVCEDYDLWLRLCAEYPVLFLDEPLIIKYGGHADQLSRKYFGMDRFRVRALDNVIRNASLPVEDHDAAIAELQRKIDIYLKGAEKHGNPDCVEEFREMQAWYNSHHLPGRDALKAAR